MMKPIYCLLIAGIFLGRSCKAQILDKNFIDFSPGLGIPVGSFASKDAKSIKSGLAKNGLGINMEYGHYFKAKFGWCAGLKRSVFPLDHDALLSSNANITNAASDPWRLFLVYAGLIRRKQIDDKIILSYKAAGGLATSRYPAAVIDYSSGSRLTITSNAGSALALVIGLDLKYRFSEKIQFALKFDYLSTSPKFIVSQTVYRTQSQITYKDPYTQNIQAITAGVSASYNF